MNKAHSLRRLFPSADPLSAWKVVNNEIVQWNLPDPQPSEQEIETAWSALQADFTAASALKTALLSEWNSTFTAGEQAFLKPLFDAALSRISVGDIEGVRELIQTAPSISEDLDAKRNTLLALFP